MKSLSLKWKVALAATLMLIAVLVLVGLTQRSLLEEDLTRVLSDQQFTLVTREAEELDSNIATRVEVLARSAAVFPLDLLNSPKAIRDFYRDRPGILASFDDLLILGTDGRIIADYPELPGRANNDDSDREFFKRVMATGKPVVAKPVIGKARGEPIVQVGAPIIDKSGRVVAVLGGVIRLYEKNALAQLAAAKVGQTGYYFILSKEAVPVFVIHPRKELILKPRPSTRNEAVTRALAGFEGSAVDTNTSGTEALYSFKSLKSVDWLLVAVLPIEEAFVPIRRAQQRLVSIIIVASLLLIPAFWAIAWILLNPLSALREKIERVRHLPEIYTPVLAHRRDEVGMLARAFNELVHSISEAGRQHQKSEAHLRAITDNIPALIAYIDADERYRFVNQTFLDWYGKTREQAIGKSLREVVGESIYSEIGPKLKQVLAGQRVTYQRAMIETTVPRTIEASWQPDFDEKGRVVGCYVLTHDITEHKHAELRQRQFSAELEDRVRDRTAELEASNSELASFAYSIAHDFRTPLRAMDGYSAMLQAEHASALSEEGKAYVGRIRAASIRLAALIDDLLRLAQLTQRELTRETVDLSALARTSLRTIQSGEPGRVVEVSIAPDLFVNGDKALLGSMMNELLGNAWKFTGRRLDAKIEIGVRDHEGEKAFFVRDNGAGFDMAYAEKLFTPFQRLHGINEFPGSGVGLALAARIIERHGGRIWPESAPGEGATFVFVLPF